MAQEPSATPWWRRAIRVGALSFFLAALVNYLGELTLTRVPVILAFLVVLLLISIGVAFDILGTSVTAADSAPFNAMAAKKVAGARQSLWLVKNADRVANFTNDVVGDVAGAVTGAAGATVALQMNNALQGSPTSLKITTLAVVGLIAALTVGGKAAGKTFAIENATDVVMVAGRVLYGYEKVTGRTLTGGRSQNPSRRRPT